MTLTGSSRARRICVAYFVVVILSFLLSLTRINPLLFPGDFISFYGAGFMLSDGQGQDLYDVDRQTQVQEQLLAETGRNTMHGVIKFFYPAAFGWVFFPLTGLPLLSAYVIWNFLVSKLWLEQTLFVGLVVTVWLTTLSIRKSTEQREPLLT